MAEQELRDLAIERNDIALNETGDLAMVDGMDSVRQSVALDVRDIAHFEIGATLTSDTVFELQASIEQSLRRDPQITTPITIEPESIDKQSGVINFHVTTRDNEEFTLDIVLPE